MAKASKTQQALIENVLDDASSFKRGTVQLYHSISKEKLAAVQFLLWTIN